MFVNCASPNADVNSTFTPSTGGDVFAVINDPMGSPNDLTYAYLDGVDAQNQDVEYPEFSLGSNVEKILFLYVEGRFFDTLGAGDIMRNLIYVNGTRYSGDNHNTTITPISYRDYYPLNPDTGLAWIQADIQGTGANPLEYTGFRAIATAGNQCRISQQFMCVYHQENETGRIVRTVAQPIVKSITQVIS